MNAARGRRRTPMAVQRCRYRAANFPRELSRSVEGQWQLDDASRRREERAREGTPTDDETHGPGSSGPRIHAPSPRAFSAHSNEFGFGFIQNLNMSFHAGSSLLSPALYLIEEGTRVSGGAEDLATVQISFTEKREARIDGGSDAFARRTARPGAPSAGRFPPASRVCSRAYVSTATPSGLLPAGCCTSSPRARRLSRPGNRTPRAGRDTASAGAATAPCSPRSRPPRASSVRSRLAPTRCFARSLGSSSRGASARRTLHLPAVDRRVTPRWTCRKRVSRLSFIETSLRFPARGCRAADRGLIPA